MLHTQQVNEWPMERVELKKIKIVTGIKKIFNKIKKGKKRSTKKNV